MKFLGAVLALFCVLLSSSARAEEFTRKRFVLSDGSFEVTGDPARPAMVGINASRGSFGDPMNIAPHFYWGVTNNLTLGISHETGLCLGDNCYKTYNDAGFDLMYHLVGPHDFELELHAGVPVSSFDPFRIGVRAGVLGRVNLGSVAALVFDPSIYIGLNKRRELGNREYLDIPFWFYFQATDVVVPFVGSAFSDPLDGFLDRFALPLEGGILFDVAQSVDVGFMMRFHRLLGPDGDADQRGLYFLGRFRF